MLLSRRLTIKARRIVVLVAAIACACPAGCVQRRMVIRSNPPGAVVYVDDYQIGTTPVATNFTYYGTRRIRLVKNGYETLTVMQPVTVPWYEITPVDFISENLIPGKIHDTRTFDYQLAPQLVVPSDQLLDRAEGLRRQTRGSGVVQTSPPLRAGSPPRGASPQWTAPSASPMPISPPGGFSSPASPGVLGPAPSSGMPPSALPPSSATSPISPF
jgi:hypothetical protein